MVLPYSCRLCAWQHQLRILRHAKPSVRLFSSSTTVWPDRILSGIQPTGVLHVGNYFGAVKNWVDLQNSNRNVLCAIVDLHSMTLPYDHQKLPHHILLMAASLLGCGIDPEKSILFLQSEVPQHTQLCWILSTCTTLRRLAQLPQYSEKSEYVEKPLLGLLWYPVLQAADILVYKATQIPVGKDQTQHLQIANALVRFFNNKYGETFPYPRPIFNNGSAARIRSLTDPSKKMSKSFPDPNSRIDITDTPDLIASKLKLAQVESGEGIVYDPKGKPGVSNLIEMHSALTGRQVSDLCLEFKDFDVERYRETVTEVMVETLRPIQSEIDRLLNDKEYILSALKKGTQKATDIAADTWQTVTERTGNHLIKCEKK